MRKYLFWPDNAAVRGFAVLNSSGQVRQTVHQTAHQTAQTGGTSRSRSKARVAARRRLVLTVLLVALCLPVLVGLATGAAAAWWVAICLLPVVCTYLAVLFRTRRLSAEREINVAFFGGPQRGEFGLDDMLPSGYEFPAGYEPDELRAAGARR